MTSHSEDNNPSTTSLAPSPPSTPSQATQEAGSQPSHGYDGSSAGTFVPTRTSQITPDSPISTDLQYPSQTSTPATTDTGTVPTSKYTRDPDQQQRVVFLLRQSEKTQAALHARHKKEGRDGDPAVELGSLK